MKIALDTRLYGLENGGLGRYAINLVDQLIKLDRKNEYTLLLGEKYYNSLSLPPHFEKVKINSRHYGLSEQYEVLRILHKISPDLTHFLHFNVPYLYNLPYIVTIHDLLMHSGIGREATTLPYWKYIIKRLGYRKIFDHAVKAASKVIVPTNFVKEELIKVYGPKDNRISVIYEGVSNLDLDLVKIEKGFSQKYFLYAGNAYPHKNLETLVKAIYELNKLNFKSTLVLVTPRDVFTKRLKKLVKDLSAESFVVLKNNVSDKELYALYKNSVAFVYPSFSEGFGLQGLEAMKVGTRLVASDISVFHEVYKDNAEFFDPNSWGNLVDVMKIVLNENKPLRNKKITKAENFVKQYSWGKMTRDTLALYAKA